MANREDAIKGLEQFKADFKPFCGNGADWAKVDDAITLLKEQAPKPIVRKQRKIEHPDGSIDCFAEWYCPHCGKLLHRGFNATWIEFCFKCGKAVTWNDN